MTNPTTSPLLRTGATTLATTSSPATLSSPSLPPAFLGMTSSGSAGRATLDLSFTTEMKAGSGAIYVTDGAVQTVIDSATGQPTLRIVGGSDTHQISPSSLRYDGNHVFIDAYGLKPGLHYSVIIAPGALVSTADKAFAGLRSPGYASFSAPGADTTGPTLVSMEFDSTTVKAGHDIAVKLTFSEKLSVLDASAFSAPHVQLTGLMSEDGVTWYGVLRAAETGIAVANNTLSVDMSKVRDLAGNAGSGTVPGAHYDVDTIVTSHVTSWVSLYDDAGPLWDDMVTNGDSQLIEGTISGKLGAGQRFELLLDGKAVDPADISIVEYPEGPAAGYAWSVLAELAEGKHTLVARIVDGSHSSGEVVREIVIDNTAPVFTSSADGATAFGLDSPVVIKLAENVYWERSEGSDDAIQIEDREGNITYRSFASVEQSEDGLTLTIPASVLALTAGNDYTIRLPSTLTDLAGNNFGEQAIHLHTAGTYVDVMPPRALSAKVINHAGTYGIGAEIDIRIKFNEPVALVDGARPTLALNNGGTATFVSINAANELVFKYVVAAGQDTWELDISDYGSLLGSVADLAGHRLDRDHVEFWYLDNDTADNFGSDIVIVTTGPTPLALPQLATGSDTGATGDHVTADSTPTFYGGGALPGAPVFLYDGDTVVASGSADAAGNWSLTPALALGDGNHNLNVRHADALGNRSGPSPSFPLRIDTSAAALAAPELDASSDSGAAHDRITNNKMPTINGSGAEAGAQIGLYIGSTKIGTALADASGRWTATTAPLADGTHVIVASQVDTAGNRSADSAGLTIQVDTAAAAPAAPVLDSGSDSGIAGDRITRDTTPTLGGGGAEANATIELYVGESLVGSSQADASGNWSVTAAPQANGSHTFTVRQVDMAGNRSAASAGVTVTIDTTAASAPGVPVLASGSDSGVAGDLTTKVTTPTLTGSGAEPGATVELYAGATKVGQAVADSGGAWSASTIPLADGIHTINAYQTDAAGNRSVASGSLVIRIDSTAGAALAAPLLDDASDTGVKGDNFTKDNTPTLTGTGAEGGATVELYAGSTFLGSGTADGSGRWSVTSSTLPDGIASITAVQVDAAGNRSAMSAATAIKIRTTGAAAVSSLELDSGSDSGIGGDRITNDRTPTIRGSGAEAGATVELYAGEAKVGSAVADSSGNWSVTASTLADGNHAFTAKQVDAAGNVSPVSSALAVRIDTSTNAAPGEPRLAPASDSGALDDMISNDNTPRITGGDAVAGATIRLYSNGVPIGTTTADASGNWFIEVATALADGTYSLTATQTNEAGNESAHSLTASLKVDTVAGAPPLALDAGSDTGIVGDRITRLATPTVKGSAEAGATVVLYEGTTVLGTTTADAGGNWSVASTALADGVHTLFAKQTDLAGNVSAASAELQVTVDTVAPAALAAPGLAASSDSGTKGDRITNDSTPTITGSGAVPGATVHVFNGSGGLKGTTTADDSGTWTFDITTPYLDGGYTIFVKQSDSAGNMSTASETVAFYFDTAVTTPNIALMPVSDADGKWDYITKVNKPTFGGTGEAYATVRVYAGATEVGSATVGSDGKWTLTTLDAVADGIVSFTAIQTDRAGNVSGQGGPVPLTIDTSAPSAPGAPVLVSDTGVLGDGITMLAKPELAGHGAEAGATVELYEGTTLLGSSVADGSGHWSVTPDNALADGHHSVVARQLDLAGNRSEASVALDLVIDTAPPLASLSTPQAYGREGIDERRILNYEPTLVGSGAEKNGTVYVYNGETRLGEVVADPDMGNWEFPPSGLADGTYHIVARQMDAAGNEVHSAPLDLVIDTHIDVPTLKLAPESDNGLFDDDGITQQTSLTFSGSAEPGAEIAYALLKLYSESGDWGKIYADDAGAWQITLEAIAEGERGAPDGTYLFYARQTDAAGNISDQAAVEVTVDTTAPANPHAMPWLTLAPNETFQFQFMDRMDVDSIGPIRIVRADDHTPVASIALHTENWSLDGFGYTQLLLPELEEGTYLIELDSDHLGQLRDLAGNSGDNWVNGFALYVGVPPPELA